MHELKGSEKIFYEDQNSVHECSITEEVDPVHQMEVEVLNSTLWESEENENLNLLYAQLGCIFESQRTKIL